MSWTLVLVFIILKPGAVLKIGKTKYSYWTTGEQGRFGYPKRTLKAIFLKIFFLGQRYAALAVSVNNQKIRDGRRVLSSGETTPFNFDSSFCHFLLTDYLNTVVQLLSA